MIELIIVLIGFTSPIWVAFSVVSFIRWIEYRAHKKWIDSKRKELDDSNFQKEHLGVFPDREEIEHE